MLRKGQILAISVIAVSFVTVLSIDAQQDSNIPQWVKNTALWWGQGDISDADYISGINFLIDQKILQVSTTQDNSGWKDEAGKLYKDNQQLEGDLALLEKEVEYWKNKYESVISISDSNTKSDKDVQHYNRLVPIDKEFSAGPFRFHLIEAGTAWGEVDGEAVEFYRVTLDVTNKRGSSVSYTPSVISLTDSNGYALQHEFTNGLKVRTVVPAGGKISGYYTFEKPATKIKENCYVIGEEYQEIQKCVLKQKLEGGTGTFKLFIEVSVIDDIYVSDNWYYSGEIEFNSRGY